MRHLANVAHRVDNRKLWFDAETERFDNAKANRLLSREPRPAYARPQAG